MEFKIDFFELMFLAEACIQPTPIARHSFWYDLCDIHYHKMNNQQRNEAFKWITKNPQFSMTNIDNLYFYCRFNPNNQYIITSIQGTQIAAFLFQNAYYTKKTTSINPDFIKEVEKYERISEQ